MTITVTSHAYLRAKQRMGLKGKAVDKRIQQAWDRGATSDQMPPMCHAWIESKVRPYPDCTAVRVFNEFVFFFAETRCVTLYPLPRSEAA